jgi:hypothetical protein
MAVTNGPNLGLIISAATGDTFDSDFRKLLRALDALLNCSVISRTTTAPPGSPANGDRYIVPAGATGTWAGQTDKIASWTTADPTAPAGKWEFWTPKVGFRAYSQADSALYVYDGTSWALA